MDFGLDDLRQMVEEPLAPAPGQLTFEFELGEYREEPCLCGGTIIVDDDDIFGAVARHIMSARHQEWSDLGGMWLPLDAEMWGRVKVEA